MNKTQKVQTDGSGLWDSFRKSDHFYVFTFCGAAGLVVLLLLAVIVFQSYRSAQATAAEKKEKERVESSAAFWKSNSEAVSSRIDAIFGNPQLSLSEKKASIESAFPSEFLPEIPPQVAERLHLYERQVDDAISQQGRLASEQRAKRQGFMFTLVLILGSVLGIFVLLFLTFRHGNRAALALN
jgi:heme/copper-type cytochrome/quinol oxidase subunit 3